MRITVGGSMQYTEKMLEICAQLEQLGHKAFTSKFADAYVGKSDVQKEEIKLDHKYNHDAIREFLHLIEETDALLVANYTKHGIENYIGGNAFLEMGFAHFLYKKIYLVNPIPEMPYYGTELIAMRPIVLNGDLTMIR